MNDTIIQKLYFIINFLFTLKKLIQKYYNFHQIEIEYLVNLKYETEVW